jgi:uncharacterized iron-regulated protein
MEFSSIFVPMKKQLAILTAGLMLLSFTTDKPAYRIFNSTGKEVPFSKIMKSLYEADVILFGESHDNPIAHWLQKEVTADLYANSRDALILGAEMFEADYKPLLKFAFDHKLPFIATNVPRRYANLVYREGFEGLEKLSPDARRYIPPLPVRYDPELPGYKQMLGMGHGAGVEATENLPKAQAIKDATMGYFILKNWSPGKQFLHFNGSGHSDNREGIVWYLLQDRPDLKIVTITTVMQDTLDELEDGSAGRADFIIVVPDNMTRTY